MPAKIISKETFEAIRKSRHRISGAISEGTEVDDGYMISLEDDTLDRLESLRLPGETLDDCILRVIRISEEDQQ